MVGTKAEVDIFEVVKVANKTSGRDNEKKSESHLRDDEDLAKTAWPQADEIEPACSLRVAASWTRVALKAGATPKKMPQRKARAMVKRRTGRLSEEERPSAISLAEA